MFFYSSDEAIETCTLVPVWVSDIYHMPDFDKQMNAIKKRLLPANARLLEQWRSIDDGFVDSLLYSILFNKQCWKDIDEYVRDAMATQGRLFRAQRMVADFKAGCTLQVVLIMGCAGINVGLLALKYAFERICTVLNPRLNLVVLECWIYEINQDAIDVGQLVTQGYKFPVIYKGDMENGPQDIAELETYSSVVKFVLMGSTECNNVSFASGIKSKPGTSGLHGPVSRTSFAWHKTCRVLARKRGPSNIVHIGELPQCKDECDEKLLDKQFGPAVKSNASKWNNDAERKRKWRTSPMTGEAELFPMHVPVPNKSSVYKDGSQWFPTAAAYNGNQSVPVVLRRYWPRLLERQLDANNRMTPYEQMTIESLRVKFPNGEVRYAGVEFFLRHLGLEFSALQGIKDHFPCLKMCNRYGATDADPKKMLPCGQQILCQPCNRAIQLLGGCWHFPTAAEITTRVLMLAVNYWMCGGPMPDFWQWEHPHHDCGKNCPQAP